MKTAYPHSSRIHRKYRKLENDGSLSIPSPSSSIPRKCPRLECCKLSSITHPELDYTKSRPDACGGAAGPRNIYGGAGYMAGGGIKKKLSAVTAVLSAVGLEEVKSTLQLREEDVEVFGQGLPDRGA